MKSKQQHTMQLNKYYNITIYFMRYLQIPGLDIKYNNTSNGKKENLVLLLFQAHSHTTIHKMMMKV